jgi:hypothetical protein
MKTFSAFLLTGLLVTGSAFAQQNPPAAAPPASQSAAPAETAPAMTKSGKPKAKDVREQCRADADSKGLKGKERRKAVEDCFVKARPDLAAKEECRLDPKLKALDKDARKAAIKECIEGKK